MKAVRKKALLYIGMVLSGLLPLETAAQKWSVSTNLLQYVNLLTLNAETAYSPAKHWSVTLGFRYNPFTYRGKQDPRHQFQNRNLTLYTGGRYWPFFTFSGIYYGARFQWTRYNAGGIFSGTSTEGDAVGLCLQFGYALLLTPYLNLEFGAGMWTGRNRYTHYACTKCGRIVGQGSRWFLGLDELSASLSFIF